MLPKKNRISRKEFPSYTMRGIPNQQIRVSDVEKKLFTVVFYKNSVLGDQNCHISVVVSKKTAKRAVDRNYLRRRFYDLVGVFLGLTSEPFTAVFYPKIDAQKAPQEVLKLEIEKAFKNAKLTK